MTNNTRLVNGILELLEEEWNLSDARFQLIVINYPKNDNENQVRYTGTAPLTEVYETVQDHYNFLAILNYTTNDSRPATDRSAQ